MSRFSFLTKEIGGVPQFKLYRLRAEWRTTQERLEALKARDATSATAWWAAAAQRSLESAENAAGQKDLDGGWGGVHDAQRFMVFGINDAELLAQVASLSEETQAKLSGWRAKATTSLLPDPNTLAAKALTDDQRERLRQAVVESMAVLHGHSDNLYHQLRLVGRQLNYLVGVCLLVLFVVFVTSLQSATPGSPFATSALLPVAMAGALGGIISAMWQLSRVGQARIPEAWLQGLVTSGRPIVGAVSALFIYAVLQSDLIQLVDASKVGFPAALVLAFVAGFSEKFVLRTVERVAGSDSKNEVTNKPLDVTQGGGNGGNGGGGGGNGPAAGAPAAKKAVPKKKTAAKKAAPKKAVAKKTAKAAGAS